MCGAHESAYGPNQKSLGGLFSLFGAFQPRHEPYLHGCCNRSEVISPIGLTVNIVAYVDTMAYADTLAYADNLVYVYTLVYADKIAIVDISKPSFGISYIPSHRK
ncbi:hypothetical protein J6590_064891 [Homalodisca vitripennis]|nr:hypothetical protein J6590_064891 [Homalodisca vitripennis]